VILSVLHYHGGKLIRERPGLAFFYYVPTSTVVAVLLASRDLAFAFKEVTIQGQLCYRGVAPKALAGVLDFSTISLGQWTSDEAETLPDW